MTDTRTMRSQARWSGRAALWAVTAVTLTSSGCDESIDPVQSTDIAYSIFGHLDPTVDTQWIRVAPFRTSIFSTPDPVDAVVSIEELGTGRMIDLIPTLFTPGSGNFGDTLFAYNFRTSEPIDYEATYRLTARRSDGSVSASTVQIPSDLSHRTTIVSLTQNTRPHPLDFVEVPVGEGEHLAMVHTIHYPSDSELCSGLVPIVLHHSSDGFGPAGPGYLRGFVRKVGDLIDNPGCWGSRQRRELKIFRSREEWPFDGTSDYSHSNAYSNVENGIGFFGGVVSTEVPYEDCTYVGAGFPDFCELYYGPETATLVVTLIDRTPPETIPEREKPFGQGKFRPNVFLRRGQESWRRTVDRIRIGDSLLGSPALHRSPGLLPGSYLLRVDSQFIGDFTLYCEERILDLGPGVHHLEISMDRVIDFFPHEPVNADGCREGRYP